MEKVLSAHRRDHRRCVAFICNFRGDDSRLHPATDADWRSGISRRDNGGFNGRRNRRRGNFRLRQLDNLVNHLRIFIGACVYQERSRSQNFISNHQSNRKIFVDARLCDNFGRLRRRCHGKSFQRRTGSTGQWTCSRD